MASNRSAKLGVVVPVFGHSRLVSEALASLVSQDFDGRISTVVVIDGDSDPETSRSVTSFLRAGENPIAAVFRRNGRLPAARNTGIRYLLAAEPDLDAIFFLDADNRLGAHSLAAFWQCLEQNRDAAWAYPDIGFFGLTWGGSGIDFRETAPRYSVLRHLMGNICEAGSMVRADVFRAGVYFDESFRSGYEDWEFWLQCLGRGLTGVRAEGAGFQYRRRPSSMLKDADRVSDSIRSKLLEKHQHLYTAAFVSEQFCRECAPIVALGAKDGPLLLGADGRILGRGVAALEALVEEASLAFHGTYLPSVALLPMRAETAGKPPPLTVASTLQLVDDVARKTSVFLGDDGAQLDDQQHAAAAWQAISIRDSRSYSAQTPEPLRTVFAGMVRNDQWRADHRYAGPASFQIDGFVRSAISSQPRQAAETPQKRRRLLARVFETFTRSSRPRCRIIDPRSRLAASPFGHELRASGLHLALAMNAGTLPATALSRAKYAGRSFAYETELSPPAATGTRWKRHFRLIAIVEDPAKLINAEDLREESERLIYIAGAEVNEEELYALHASEHALAGIFCLPNARTTLQAFGIPSRKLVAPDQVRSFIRALVH